MTWTYSSSPDTGTADGRRDAVRLLVGDTDTNDQQIQDEEISFALSEANDNVYRAAAQVARFIAGLYARRVDTSFDSLDTSYAQRQEHYHKLAEKLDRMAKRKGGLGMPSAGGISVSDMDSVEDDSDRVEPAFRRNQFRNPPDTDDVDSWWKYHR